MTLKSFGLYNNAENLFVCFLFSKEVMAWYIVLQLYIFMWCKLTGQSSPLWNVVKLTWDCISGLHFR